MHNTDTFNSDELATNFPIDTSTYLSILTRNRTELPIAYSVLSISNLNELAKCMHHIILKNALLSIVTYTIMKSNVINKT